MKLPLVAIADDDLAFATYLKTFLDGRGYQSRIYSHGEDLLAAAHLGELPDVVLLDVMMPGMDGIATLRSLKATHPDLQVIMLSGRVNAPTIVEALVSSANITSGLLFRGLGPERIPFGAGTAGRRYWFHAATPSFRVLHGPPPTP
jgi:CheY-like chemotaxis protein